MRQRDKAGAWDHEDECRCPMNWAVRIFGPHPRDPALDARGGVTQPSCPATVQIGWALVSNGPGDCSEVSHALLHRNPPCCPAKERAGIPHCSLRI